MSFLKLPLRSIYQFLDQPNYLRWLQWPCIFKLLDVRPGDIIIDLGAGPMQYAVWLKQKTGAEVIAIDRYPHAQGVKLAKRYAIQIICTDGQALPLEDRCVDRILMSSLLHMVPDPERLLAECQRVLKLDGHLVFSVPNHYLFIPSLYSSRSSKILQKLFRPPPSEQELISLLNERFMVGGPKGYYSIQELTELVETCGFRLEEHHYKPNQVGSFLWELSILAYVRLGSLAFHLLFLIYPLARLADVFSRNKHGSEHIVKVSPINEN